MHVLIIHPENRGIGGAEKILEYFLTEFVESNCQVSVAVVKGSRMAKLLPKKATPAWIEDNGSFSLRALWRQAQILKRACIESPVDLIHGWAARDWELASLVGRLYGLPAIGTLHEHPNAAFITKKRQLLMRWSANYGLKKIICVSAAVQEACIKSGYSSRKLAMIHNGVPNIGTSSIGQNDELRRMDSVTKPETSEKFKDLLDSSLRPSSFFRIGFLGTFSEQKGLRDFFQIADELAKLNSSSWELHLGGEARDETGLRLMADLRKCYEQKGWWQRVHWHGWVELPQSFIRHLDLLVVPSCDFEAFGLILIEAGKEGVPVLASSIGGVPEIVVDGQTGRLFQPGNVSQATAILNEMILHPDLARQMGRRAEERIKTEFSAAKMVAKYRREYFNMAKNV